ncbi:sensor histidine kinase, partial [Burkholderia pseudomallei]
MRRHWTSAFESGHTARSRRRAAACPIIRGCRAPPESNLSVPQRADTRIFEVMQARQPWGTLALDRDGAIV